MDREQRIDRLARIIFATLYDEYNYSEVGAWSEAYRRAGEMIKEGE